MGPEISKIEPAAPATIAEPAQPAQPAAGAVPAVAPATPAVKREPSGRFAAKKPVEAPAPAVVPSAIMDRETGEAPGRIGKIFVLCVIGFFVLDFFMGEENEEDEAIETTGGTIHPTLVQGYP